MVEHLSLLTFSGSDYMFSSTNQTFTAGTDSSDPPQCVNVTIIADNALEDDEMFTMNLTFSGSTIPTNGSIYPSSLTVTITDDDG